MLRTQPRSTRLEVGSARCADRAAFSRAIRVVRVTCEKSNVLNNIIRNVPALHGPAVIAAR